MTESAIAAPRTAGASAVVVRPRRRRRVEWTVWMAFVVVLAALATAILGDAIAPYPYSSVSLTQRLLPPMILAGGSGAHVLGTDALGRDLLSRLIVGLRVSLLAGFGGVLVAAALGTTVGLLSGYFRGWVENVLMMVADVKLALPGILLAIGVIAVLGSSSGVLVVVIGLGIWVGFARVVRSVVIRVRNEEFVMAARSIGAGDRDIIVRHLLPNCVTPIIVLATLEVPTAITLEASLSFLGIGIQPPTPSLGNMIADGRGYLDLNPWQTLVPALGLIILTLSVSRIGDWLTTILDPASETGTIH
ncbi:MAG: ABC transporter permease [Chloroflexota bacterium]|nr:ABC transporter permease [Chloroflexota bacterium]